MEIYCRVDFDLGLQLCNDTPFHANCFVVVLSTFHHFGSVNPSLSTKVAVSRNPQCTLNNQQDSSRFDSLDGREKTEISKYPPKFWKKFFLEDTSI